MKTSICIIAISLFGFVVAQDDMFAKFLEKAKECVAEGNVDVAVCKELFEKGVDDSQDKYTPCKCATACVAKKCDTMDESGVLQEDKIKSYKSQLPTEEIKKEAERVFPECFSKASEKKDCDAAYTLSKCGIDKSPMAKTFAKVVVNKLLETKA